MWRREYDSTIFQPEINALKDYLSEAFRLNQFISLFFSLTKLASYLTCMHSLYNQKAYQILFKIIAGRCVNTF